MDFDSDSDGGELEGGDRAEAAARGTFWRNLYQESEIDRRAASGEGSSRVPDDAEIVEHIDQLRKTVDPRHTGAEFFLGALSGRFGPGVDLGPKVAFLGGYIDNLYDDVIGAYGADNVDWDAVETSLQQASLGQRGGSSNDNQHGEDVESRTKRGTITYLDSTYEGELKDCMRHGKGICRFSNGGVYDGEWKDNKMHGKGSSRDANGSVYDGQWVRGVEHGKGTLTRKDGSNYEGDFVDGKKHGWGTLKWPSGNAYEGEFKGGLMHGKGTKTWANGDIYEGEWKDDEPHGTGTKTWASGDVYEGPFVGGKPHGRGTFKSKNGDIYEENWTDGVLSERIFIDANAGASSAETAPIAGGEDQPEKEKRAHSHVRQLRSHRSKQQRLQKNVEVKTCEHCGVDDDRYKLRVCTGCNLALYCSSACQKAASGSHRRICDIIAQLPSRDADRLVLKYDRNQLVDLDACLRYATKYMDKMRHLGINIEERGKGDAVKLSTKKLSSFLRSKAGALESVSWISNSSFLVPGISINGNEVWKELRSLKQLHLELMIFDDAQSLCGIIGQQRDTLQVLGLPHLGIAWAKAKCRRAVAQAVGACKHLVKLDLQGSVLMDPDLKVMLHDLPNLRVLNLGRNTNDTHEFTDNTCGLIARKCPDLQELNLDNHNHLSMRGICKIFEGCVHMRSFYTTTRKLTCGDIRRLLGIAPQLLNLSLGDEIGVTDGELIEIIEATGGRTLVSFCPEEGAHFYIPQRESVSAKTMDKCLFQVDLLRKIEKHRKDPEVANEWDIQLDG